MVCLRARAYTHAGLPIQLEQKPVDCVPIALDREAGQVASQPASQTGSQAVRQATSIRACSWPTGSRIRPARGQVAREPQLDVRPDDAGLRAAASAGSCSLGLAKGHLRASQEVLL